MTEQTVEQIDPQIGSLYNEMREIILEAGVTEKQYSRLTRHLDKRGKEYQDKVLFFLQQVHDNAYTEILRILNLLHITPEMWEMYKKFDNFGVKNLTEVVMLREAQKNMRKMFRLMPKYKAPKT